MSEFCKAKSLSIESDYANRNEIKRIDNNLEKGFSTEIDKLNESLYKINNYLKLTKDIEDLKKDNLVKNDIQRKLSLKSQWLNSNHGSTASLNSLPPFSNSKNASGHGSTQSLNKGEAKKNNDQLKKKRKIFENFKSQSVQNVNAACERPIRRFGKRSNFTSYEELDFIDRIKLSDEEVSILSQEPNFQEKKEVDDLSKVVERKSQIRSLSASRGSSVTSSQRDISRFFPKKEIISKPSNVNKNQKELKDVDLKKYFLPTPVQELKSLPSPGQSPKLPRKPPLVSKSFDETQSNATTSLLRTAMDNLQKTKRPDTLDPNDDTSGLRNAINNLHRIEKSKSLNIEPKMEGFTLRNHQMDGDVCLKKPSKTDKFQFEKSPKFEASPCSGYESISLSDKPKRKKAECESLFDDMKPPADNIDELFEQVAADVIPEVPKPKVIEKVPMKIQPPKVIRKVAERKPIEIKKVEIKSSFPPAAKWCRRELVGDPNKREAEILSKLSSNLLNEIKLLEQHLQLNDDNKNKEERKEEKKVKKIKKDKKAEEPIDKCNIEHMQTEEELNNAIDDILMSIPVKEEQTLRTVFKKVTHVALPKPTNGLRSETGHVSKIDSKSDKKNDHEPTQSKKVPITPLATKVSASPKQQTEKSADTVDFAFKPKIKRIKEKTSEPLIRSSEMIQRVASIEKDLASFMVEQSIPSVDEICSATQSTNKQTSKEPKIEITQPTPQIEKDVITFTFIKPARKKSPETKQETAPKLKDTNSIEATTAVDTNKDLKTMKILAHEPKPNTTETHQRDASIENSSKEKPSINELIRKITSNDKERPSIENKLLIHSNRKPMLSKTYKVHLPLDEPELTIKPSLTAKISTPIEREEPQKKDIIESRPSLDVKIQANKNNTEPPVPPVLKQESGIKSVTIDQKDLLSFMPRKSTDKQFKRIDSIEARNTFLTESDMLNLSEKPNEQSVGANTQKNSENPSHSNVEKTKTEPPMKPARRRSRLSSVTSMNEVSGDEQITIRKNESSPIASTKHKSLPNRETINFASCNLPKLENTSKPDEIPKLKNIVQILDTPKNRKTEIEVVELMDNYTKPLNKHEMQSNIENDDRKYNENDNKNQMDVPKHEHRLSGYSEYDNVVPTVTRRTKLSETRKQSRSFELPPETDLDYDNINVNLARKSADRLSPSPGVSTLDRKKNVTDMLLERSKNLHHKKQEFMTEKLTESNPYIRRMMEKEARFRPGYERSRISPLSSASASSHYTQPYSHSISRPLPSSVTTTSSPLSYNTRITAPASSSSSSSTGRGVLNRFKHPTSSNKDSCIIS